MKPSHEAQSTMSMECTFVALICHPNGLDSAREASQREVGRRAAHLRHRQRCDHGAGQAQGHRHHEARLQRDHTNR